MQPPQFVDIHLEDDDSSDEEYQPDDEEEDETAEEVSGYLCECQLVIQKIFGSTRQTGLCFLSNITCSIQRVETQYFFQLFSLHKSKTMTPFHVPLIFFMSYIMKYNNTYNMQNCAQDKTKLYSLNNYKANSH